jgi:acetyl-CoA synthetase
LICVPYLKEVWKPGQSLNIAEAAVSRHAQGLGRDRIALSWSDPEGSTHRLSFGQLEAKSSRMANLLVDLGIRAGDAVAILAGPGPELVATALGCWKHQAVFTPLFAAFGPEPIFERLNHCRARAVVTTEGLYRQKIAPILARLPGIDVVLLTDVPEPINSRLLSLPRLAARASEQFCIPATDPETPATYHFTSGTTGAAKAAVHVHHAVLSHAMTGRCVLELQPEDTYWCTADPGWVTGISYGVIAPLVCGATSILYPGGFDAADWMQTLARNRVTVWYTAPTALRRLMRLGDNLCRRWDLSHLRGVFSVGEPLDAEAVYWGQKAFGLTIRDTWWQTETGAIMIANLPGDSIRPGSMGRPVPGIEAAIVARDANGSIQAVSPPEVTGEIALAAGWPSMFRGYLNEPQRYARCFAGSWYLTGDLARKDADGYFFYVGRADDIITTSGHRVGPFEIESVLLAHPAVLEAGVIGLPDPMLGERIKAFVCLRPGFEPEKELNTQLLAFCRKQLGASLAPREIAWCDQIPKNRAGKLMRRLLKARELGLDPGDTSTEETQAP